MSPMFSIPLPSILKESAIILTAKEEHGFSVVDQAAAHPWFWSCVRYACPNGTVILPGIVKKLHVHLLLRVVLIMTASPPVVFHPLRDLYLNGRLTYPVYQHDAVAQVIVIHTV